MIYVIAVEQPQSSSTYMEVLLRLQALGDPAQAFCNFVLFCVCDKTVRTKLCPFACRFSFKRREIAEESVNRRVGMGSPVHGQIMDPSSS